MARAFVFLQYRPQAHAERSILGIAEFDFVDRRQRDVEIDGAQVGLIVEGHHARFGQYWRAVVDRSIGTSQPQDPLALPLLTSPTLISVILPRFLAV